MTCATETSLRPLRVSALLNIAAVLLLLTCIALIITQTFTMSIGYAAQSLTAFIGQLLVLAQFLPQHQPLTYFGAANAVTLVRAGITALFAGLIGQPALTPKLAWIMTALATAALILDGLDGWLARRCGTQSLFGARFDMEVDAFFILILTVLAWQSGKAGVWVILSGALRYGFVLLGYALPWLNQPLPPSRRRQTVCVIQTVVLVLCLTPPLIPPMSTVLAAAALGLLALSFAVDMAWLWRRNHLPA
ncbi:MAG TPA: CDP-alcohol phosphatidyltransferase family protein [Candidatus Competibacteraceae bacterium]|nr:CDP-alcohol phosphatidyltransferase family protein [Candidatus Competibacteraceae bacterium]HPF58831.1 CDP-alcohol phosphatidyltransferase family protein [Candidatus Competibacteraceae bacterium]